MIGLIVIFCFFFALCISNTFTKFVYHLGDWIFGTVYGRLMRPVDQAFYIFLVVLFLIYVTASGCGHEYIPMD